MVQVDVADGREAVNMSHHWRESTDFHKVGQFRKRETIILAVSDSIAIEDSNESSIIPFTNIFKFHSQKLNLWKTERLLKGEMNVKCERPY